MQGGYITGSLAAESLKTGILNLLPELKNEAIALVDTIAPDDFILNSPLGMSDGQVYKHLQSVLWQTPGTFERPKWWNKILRKSNEKSKL